MTDSARFAAGICISLFVHFMLFQGEWAPGTGRPGRGERLAGEMTTSAPMFSETVTVALESFAEQALPGGGDDVTQKERRAYLEAVSNAIHSRRFLSPEARADFIGLALFSFVVAPDGTFHNVRLTASSGRPVLDRAAEVAIRGASGAVKRPASLGDEEIPLVMAVKYQYDL